MIVADTSALISLSTADCLDLVLDEFDVHTTETVVRELEETAEYDDSHGRAADAVLRQRDRLRVHDCDGGMHESSRIDAGEASCLVVDRELGPAFLLTDDIRAVPELRALAHAQVAISPIVLRALVKRGVLTDLEARDRLDRIAESRDWLGAPIYRRARRMFDEADHG